jgi:hypothetical protein
MGGGGSRGIGGFISDAVDSVSDGLADFEDSGLDSAAAFAVNPLIAQDLLFSSMASGEGSRDYLAAPGEFLANPGRYVSDQRNALELAQFNIAMLFGAAGAGALSPGAAGGLMGLNGLSSGAAYASAAGGLAAGGATQAAGNAMGTGAMDQAARDARDAAEANRRAVAESAAARAAAIAAVPKDPTVDEIARQRRAKGGRRGTILTTPGQSLGSTGQGKNLLGL